MCGRELAAAVRCVARRVNGVCRRAQEVQMAGARERERGVALIWSAILVSANQGLPVSARSLGVHLPEKPADT